MNYVILVVTILYMLVLLPKISTLSHHPKIKNHVYHHTEIEHRVYYISQLIQAKVCGLKYIQYILIGETCIKYVETTYAANIMYPSDSLTYVLRDEN